MFMPSMQAGSAARGGSLHAFLLCRKGLAPMKTMLRYILTLALICFAPIAGAQDAALAQAKQLMDKRDAAGAYKLLKPLED